MSWSKSKKQEKLSAPPQKLAEVMETASLNEAELLEYCRKEGLYPEQVKGWRSQAEQAMSGTMVSGKEHQDALKAERQQREKVE